MKKFLFTILTCFSVFFIAGCSDDSDDGNNSVPFEELLGTYEVTFFGTQVLNVRDYSDDFLAGMADLMYVTNSCAKATELYPDVIGSDGGMKNLCPTEDAYGNPMEGTANLLDGAVVIANKEGLLAINSRVQLGGEVMDQFAPADKYQYTIYNPTNDFVDYKGMGVTGWNYDKTNDAPSANSTSFPESPYQITKLSDGSVQIVMTLVGKRVNVMDTADMTVDAKTTVIMKKTSNETADLENKIQKSFTEE